jgi:hypothetical protein
MPGHDLALTYLKVKEGVAVEGASDGAGVREEGIRTLVHTLSFEDEDRTKGTKPGSQVLRSFFGFEKTFQDVFQIICSSDVVYSKDGSIPSQENIKGDASGAVGQKNLFFELLAGP